MPAPLPDPEFVLAVPARDISKTAVRYVTEHMFHYGNMREGTVHCVNTPAMVGSVRRHDMIMLFPSRETAEAVLAIWKDVNPAKPVTYATRAHKRA